VLRDRHKPGRGPDPPTARDDPCLPKTHGPINVKTAPLPLSPTRNRTMPPTRTKAAATNSHGYLRDTHSSLASCSARLASLGAHYLILGSSKLTPRASSIWS
jgi:hypothetical protein